MGERRDSPQSLESLLSRFLGGGRGGGGGGGGGGTQKGVILRIPPDAPRFLLEQLAVEPSLQGFDVDVQRQLKELKTSVDKIILLSKTISKPFICLEGMIIDPRTAHVEVKQRLSAIAAAGREYFEHQLERASRMIEAALEHLSKTRGQVDEEVMRYLSSIGETVKVLKSVLLALLFVIPQLRSTMYLNMPAEIRSPVANQLLGFDIVR